MTKEIEELSGELATLTSQFTRVRDKIAAAGLTDSIGLLLQKHRADLPDVSSHRQRIRARQAEISRVRANLIELEDQRADLANLEPHVRRVMETVNLESQPGQQHEVEAALRELLKARQGYLESQIADANTYINGLVIDLDVAERSLVAEIEAYTQFINERILWIRSAPPLAIADAERAWDGLLRLIDWDQWNTVLANLGSDLRENPGIYLMATVVFIPLLLGQSRFRRRIYLIDRQTTHAYAADIRPTVEALVLTALIAVVWPGLLAMLAWRIAAPANASLHAQTIAYGLRVTAALFLSMELLRQICRPKGVGEAHFGWPREAVGLVGRNLRWSMLLGLPTTFVVAVVEAPEIDFHRSSLGRLAFVAGLVSLTVFAHRMLDPKHGLLTKIDRSGNAWLWGQTRAWHLLAVGAPLSLAGVAALGYFYTALHLTWRLQSTLWLLVGLLLVHAFALRWLLIARRKLAIKQARDRRAAALAQSHQVQIRSGEIHAHSAATTATNVMAAMPVDLGTIDLQTRRLLRSCMLTAVVVGSWLIWIDILPALGVLDRCQLWQYNTDVNEMIVTANGQATTPISGTAYVTLADLLMAGVILLMTAIAGRNLPGLLEIAFLQRLPLDPGGRYAVTTISRYLITLVGLAMAFWMIGVSWSNVKWLAAAMTVGLGFGLQEIFANFVSGLIILFERPLRVGDTVTVGGVNGTVTRIRIRATTITDWDRKELIVPNREFITGQLINWTLSDSILRIVVKVGVAYGSDVSLVHALLLQVAHEEPRVLKEPPPTAIFNQIGDSPFDFELRVFVAGLDEYQTLRHELNSRIEQLLREAGIELSFPQRAFAAKPVEAIAGVLPQRTHSHKLAS
jgi:potassium efflux system protein